MVGVDGYKIGSDVKTGGHTASDVTVEAGGHTATDVAVETGGDITGIPLMSR